MGACASFSEGEDAADDGQASAAADGAAKTPKAGDSTAEDTASAKGTPAGATNGSGGIDPARWLPAKDKKLGVSPDALTTIWEDVVYQPEALVLDAASAAALALFGLSAATAASNRLYNSYGS